MYEKCELLGCEMSRTKLFHTSHGTNLRQKHRKTNYQNSCDRTLRTEGQCHLPNNIEGWIHGLLGTYFRMSVSFSSRLFYKCCVSSEKQAQQQTQLISDTLPCVVSEIICIIFFLCVKQDLVPRDTEKS